MAEFGARYVRRTEDLDEEKTFFNVKPVTKYGTSNSSSRSMHSESYEYFIRHTIKSTDTLNSIALNYGLKTSVIKQVNRLWDDSIFLYDSLLVPISNKESLPPGFKGEILTRSEASKAIPKPRKARAQEPAPPNEGQLSTSTLLGKAGSSGNGGLVETPASTDDYFSKFDSSILQIKSNLERLEKESRPSAADQRPKKSGARSRACKNPVPEPAMKFYRNPDGSSEAKIQERFEKLENEIFQL